MTLTFFNCLYCKLNICVKWSLFASNVSYTLGNTQLTWNKELLDEYPKRTDESTKGKDKPNKEPCSGPFLAQTTLCVCITCHLACGNCIDPISKA